MSRREFLQRSTAVAAQAGVSRLPSTPWGTQLQPVDLTVEYLKEPLGIDVLNPRLSWQFRTSRRGAKQHAYQIEAASNRGRLLSGPVDLWDSGKIVSDDHTQMVYAGKPLQSRTAVWWRVRVWDESDRPSIWSKPSFWDMGLLAKSDWGGKWIGDMSAPGLEHTYTVPAPYFRKVWGLPQSPLSGRAYISGLGFYELYINGSRVGDHVLSPNQTDYDRRYLRRLLYPHRGHANKRVLYVTYDVTSHLRQGRNVVGIILGNGWYNQRDRLAEGYMWYDSPRLIFQLESRMADGSTQVLSSDDNWKCASSGPIKHDGIFTGEDYDARVEMDGWLDPEYEDGAWGRAKLVRPPTGQLKAQMAIPDRIVRTLDPVSVTTLRDGVKRYDFGQNLAGWARLTAEGPRGSDITLRFIEEGGAGYGQSDRYVFKGIGKETYAPRFTWHGYRYVDEISSSKLTSAVTLSTQVVHADVRSVGTFECSEPLFNKLMNNVRWAQSSNMHCGIPSGSPHRERLGYTGDAQVDAESAIYNFDMAPFYAKWIHDLRDSQNSVTGFVPHTAPFEGGGGGPPWGCAYIVVPWLMYLYYGDRRTLRDNYSGMTRWIEYLKGSTDKSGLVVREEPGSWCLGEWATPTPVSIPKPLVNTCYFAYVSGLMSQIAAVLGNDEDRQHFAALAASASRAVNVKFLDEASGQYYNGRQGTNVFPLAFRVAPKALVGKVFSRLVDLIQTDDKMHFDTGMYGTPLTLEVLTSSGRADLALKLMTQMTMPSYGFEVSSGATALWENWDGSGSHNHAMYASVARWFYKYLAGISPDPAEPGFKNIVICPYLVNGIDHVSAEYDSIQGRIVIRWQKEPGKRLIQLDIPAGATATVMLPTADVERITESGGSLGQASHVRLLAITGGRATCNIGSGHYSFEITS